MAIVVDPDLLNRNEVIFGTFTQELSAFPVGAAVSGLYDPELTDGDTDIGFIFNSVLGDFIVADVAAGDILSIKTGADAGHYSVSGVLDATTLRVDHIDNGDPNVPTDWIDTAQTGLVYDIRNPTGGNMVDGATEQAVYSFNKEEWRVDGELFGGDDLIRHEFPFETITEESFEIGGGLSHDDWDFFSNDTKERIRTGGWDSVDSASVKQTTYAGIITLGSVDSDAQVYYQPSGVEANPINFVLTGAVNQAILAHDVNGTVTTSGFDTRSFLKIFVRKKKRDYDQSDLVAINKTQMKNNVNSFPLTHDVDGAIIADDAELVGHDPWTNFQIIDTGSNGVTADVNGSIGTFTAAGENFDVSSIAAGDVIEITGGTNDNGFFLIVSVDSATVLTLNTFESGAFTGESSLTYETHDRSVIDPITNDGTIVETATPGSGTLTSLVGGFAATVAIGDILRINEPGASGLEGVYKVLAVNSDTELGINTSDQAFPSTNADQIDYEVFEPGMFLQQKAVDIPISATTTLAFADADPDTITRAVGSWITDGVIEGDKITIAGSASNDRDFVVRIVAATVITLDALDTLVTEGAVAATATVTRHFTRTINGDDFPFLWRCFGNNATATKIFEFIQRELRRITDIDNGSVLARGDITDLLMSFASPNGVGLNTFIDDLDANDTNNVTFNDAVGTNRAVSFVAAGTIVHNTFMINDSDAVVRMMFTTNPGGNFGTKDAIIVNDALGAPISYNVSASPSRSFTFDYDNNVQGGRTPSTDAGITLVSIGLNDSQYVLFQGTITRAVGLTFSLVAARERNYSNP